jgi:hypothetical protein
MGHPRYRRYLMYGPPAPPKVGAISCMGHPPRPRSLDLSITDWKAEDTGDEKEMTCRDCRVSVEFLRSPVLSNYGCDSRSPLPERSSSKTPMTRPQRPLAHINFRLLRGPLVHQQTGHQRSIPPSSKAYKPPPEALSVRKIPFLELSPTRPPAPPKVGAISCMGHPARMPRSQNRDVGVRVSARCTRQRMQTR